MKSVYELLVRRKFEVPKEENPTAADYKTYCADSNVGEKVKKFNNSHRNPAVHELKIPECKTTLNDFLDVLLNFFARDFKVCIKDIKR